MRIFASVNGEHEYLDAFVKTRDVAALTLQKDGGRRTFFVNVRDLTVSQGLSLPGSAFECLREMCDKHASAQVEIGRATYILHGDLESFEAWEPPHRKSLEYLLDLLQGALETVRGDPVTRKMFEREPVLSFEDARGSVTYAEPLVWARVYGTGDTITLEHAL